MTRTPTAAERKYTRLFADADRAGQKAADAFTPTPMIVGSPTTPLGNDIDPAKPTYLVSEGVCGFAWVWMKGTSGFARWAKANGLARNGYPNGVMFRARIAGQSMQRREAYAQAFAAVLRDAGLDCYVETRMD